MATGRNITNPQAGPAIKTLDHIESWCLRNKNMVYIRNKDNGGLECHSHKVVANMPLKALVKKMDEGRLFECHQANYRER